MNKAKIKFKVLIIAAAIVGFASIPLYSYAIDYTTSDDNSSATDLGYTAGKALEKEAYSTGAGLVKDIKKPEGTPDFDDSPEEIISKYGSVLTPSPSSDTEKEDDDDKEECTNDDKARLEEMNATLAEYSSVTKTAYNGAMKLADKSLSSISKSDISDVSDDALKAKGLVSADDFVKDFRLYKKCKTPLPDEEFLPIPKEVLSMFN